MRQERKRGFTLVELAIVLVIIGLLIGGILVARSMIETAKVQSFIRQIQQYDTAVANFKTKFNGLPGDVVTMGCQTGNNICGNGFIEDSNGNFRDSGYDGGFNGEVGLFWANLQQSGMTAPAGVTYFATWDGWANSGGDVLCATGANTYCPTMGLGKHTNIAPVAFDSRTFAFGESGKHYYIIGDFSAANFEDPGSWITTITESIPVSEALAIDTKIDNGTPDANGSSYDILGTNVINIGTGIGTGNSCDGFGGASYAIANSDAKCVLLIKMLSPTGMDN